ncbi:MAG: S8 family serine peptidase [Planctomycetes bacterium]|nr:S8 family serine peptidase [Planctomycetota bacterium]
MPRNLCALIGALCTLAVPCTDTQAGDRGGPAAAGDRPGRHVEVHGVRQFSGRLIVRPRQHEDWVKRGASDNEAAQRSAVARSFLATYPIRRYIAETDEYVIECPRGFDENAVTDELMNLGGYEYAEPDWILYPLVCSDDPLLANQWHHAADKMQSCDAWDLHTGGPTVGVGICDTGILTTHEDLLLHRLEGYNAVDRLFESEGGQIGPVHPHGTQTTGCAAANGNNGIGVSGVGWNISHRMLRVSNLTTGGALLSDLQHAARTSIENGDRVASVSYSGVDNASNLTTATYIKTIGGLLVWAAGNDTRNLTMGDRDADDLIVVGATDSSDTKAWFSAYGPFVDVMAPGVSVVTTSSESNSSYAAVSGTSFSTPLTAGLIAQIWSSDPSLTPDEVEARLKAACDDLGSAGVDDTFGYGRINAFNALQTASSIAPAAIAGPDMEVSDGDGDGISDLIDLCPDLPSANNDDPDLDGFATPCDVCPEWPDLDQLDSNGDGVGDLGVGAPRDDDGALQRQGVAVHLAEGGLRCGMGQREGGVERLVAGAPGRGRQARPGQQCSLRDGPPAASHV